MAQTEISPTVLGAIIKKMNQAESYAIDGKAVFTIPINEPCTPLSSKSNQTSPNDEELIFSPIISSQLDTISKHRPSVISLRIAGKDLFGKEDEKPIRFAWLRRFSGVLFAIFATFSYAVATLILKLFQKFHPFTVSFWRFQGLILPSIPILIYHACITKEPIFNTIWPPTNLRTFKNLFFITLRSIIGCSSTVLQIFALKYMNMADASVIVYSSPVFVLFVARIFLGEKAGYFSIVIAVITLAGVAIISKPPMLTGEPIDSNTMLGIIFALACMATATIVYIILRYLRQVHYSVVTFCYGVEGSIECLILALAIGVFEFPRTSTEWGLLGGLVVFTWAGQTSLVLALQLEQCGVVSLIQSLDSCFAFTLQFMFLGVIPDLYSLTGASIVVSGVIMTTFRKYVAGLPPEHALRKKIGFILK